jgi:AraC family transcriptional regulator
MPPVLPAGQHYGIVGQTWSCEAFTISKVRYRAGSRTPLHANEQALLVFVEVGDYLKKVGTKNLSCDKGSILFIPAEQPQADAFGPSETSCLLVDCSAPLLRRLQESGAGVDDAKFLCGARFSSFGSELAHELKHMDCVSGLVFEGLVLSIFANSFRTRSCSSGPHVPRWLLEAKDLLHDYRSESITMEAIAREVRVNPSYLSHEFRRFFRIPPGEYLRNIRVEFAAKQLTETDLPLAEIAMEAGFADQAHFSRTFRRITHMTPLQFRKKTTK